MESIEGATVRLRLSGRWEMTHLIEGDAKRPTFGAATAEGVAEMKVDGKSMRSLLLVFDGILRSGRPDGVPNRTGAVIEWKAK